MQDKKIGIITFHFVCNCGAVLQCQALYSVLKNMGHQVQVLDYRPNYHWQQYAPVANLCREFRAIRVKYGVKTLKDRFHAYYAFIVWLQKNRISQIKFRKKRLEAFTAYLNAHISLTNYCSDINKLQKIAKDYNAFITGSDQVWNSEITNGTFDPAYFLDFASDNAICFSYAASCGKFPQDKDLFGKYLRNLSGISVRESSDSQKMQYILGVHAETVVDPTFLINANEWEKSETECRLVEQPYLLVYCLEPTQLFSKAVKEVCEITGLPIINISPNEATFYNEIEKKKLCAPGEFLYLIHHADRIITNSFHATAFSIIFHKNFVCIAHCNTGNRMINLLNNLHLSKQLYNGDKEIANAMSEIDYDSVDKIIANDNKKSLQYIESQLNSKKGQKR